MSLDLSGYTLFAIEDESGNEVIKVQGVSNDITKGDYELKIDLFVFGVNSLSTLFQIPVDSIKTKNTYNFTFTESARTTSKFLFIHTIIRRTQVR